MALIEYTLPCLGVALEAFLLLHQFVKGLWRRYPFFTVFLLFILLRDVGLFAVSWWKPEWFVQFFWRTETVSAFSRFFINWEFIRTVFPKHSKLHTVAWKCLCAVGVFALPWIALLTWGQVSSAFYILRFPSFEQYLSLCQAILLLAPAFVAFYYRLGIGRHMRGMGLGFGIYVSVCAANFAGFSAFPRFYSVGRFIPPVASVLMFVIWLWAFSQSEEAGQDGFMIPGPMTEQGSWFGTSVFGERKAQ